MQRKMLLDDSSPEISQKYTGEALSRNMRYQVKAWASSYWVSLLNLYIHSFFELSRWPDQSRQHQIMTWRNWSYENLLFIVRLVMIALRNERSKREKKIYFSFSTLFFWL